MISIIDYGADNSDQIEEILKNFNVSYKITSDEFEILKSDKIILYSDSKADYTMRRLHFMNLFSMLRMLKKPLLAIGLGMQLLCENSAENNTTCLGIIPGSSLLFDPNVDLTKQSGFMKLNIIKASPLLKDISGDELFYFDQDTYIPVNHYTTATCGDEIMISASVQNENFYGFQFNLQKSGEAGVKVIRNFINEC
jgi:glutamine amidotransferase